MKNPTSYTAFPPHSELEGLLKLLERGLFIKIKQEIERLKDLDLRWEPFLSELQRHASCFDEDKVEALLRKHLDLEPCA